MAIASISLDNTVLKESTEWSDGLTVQATVTLDSAAPSETSIRVELGGTAIPVSNPNTIQFSSHGNTLASYALEQGEAYKGFIPTKDGVLVLKQSANGSSYVFDRVDHGGSESDSGFTALALPSGFTSTDLSKIFYDASADKFYLVDTTASPNQLWAIDASTGNKAIHTGFLPPSGNFEIVGAVNGAVFFQETTGGGGRDLFGYSVSGADLTPTDPNTSSVLVENFFPDSATSVKDIDVYEVGGKPVVSFIDYYSTSAQNVKTFNLAGDGNVTTTTNTTSLSGNLSFADGVLYSLDSTTGQLTAVDERGVSATQTLPGLTEFGSGAQIIGFKLDAGSAVNELYVKVMPSGATGSVSKIVKYVTTTFNGNYALDTSFGVGGSSLEGFEYNTWATDASSSSYYTMGSDGAVVAIQNSRQVGDYLVSNGLHYDQANSTWYVDVTVSSGETSATFDVHLPWGIGAGFDDLINEGTESLTLTVNQINGTAATTSSATVTIEDGQGISGLTSVLDTDTSDGGGESEHISPFYYNYYDMGTPGTSDDSYQLRTAELWNLVYTGANVSEARFTVDGLASISAAGGLDLFIGGGHMTSFSETEGSPLTSGAGASTANYPSISTIQDGDFKLDLLASTQDSVQFTLWIGGQKRIFEISRTAKDGDSATYNLKALDDGSISSDVLDKFFNDNFALVYKDLSTAQTTAHDFDIGVAIELSPDGTTWNGYSQNGENEANYRFYNEGVKAFDAVYSDQFVQVLIDGSSRTDILGEGAAEILSDDWRDWMGHPDPSLFQVEVTVGGAVDTSYSVVDVLQDRSVLVIMNKSLDNVDSVKVKYTPPTSSNPNGDVIKNVIQTDHGVDAEAFELTATKSLDASFTADVGEAAVLGFDGRDELDAYVEQEWNWSGKATITEVAGSSVKFDFLPDQDWYVNPHNDDNSSELILSDDYVRQLYRVEMLDSTFSYSVGEQVSLAEIIGPGSDASITTWQGMIQSKDSLASTTVNEHVIITYGGIANQAVSGYPAPYVTSLNFEMYGQVLAGSQYADVIGSDFALAPITVASGGGDDIILGSVFTSDHLDGGDGTDTVIVFGDSADYEWISLDTGGYALGLKGSFSVTDSSVALNADSTTLAYSITGTKDFSADWVDVGTVDTLINIEKIQFFDQTITLAPNLPAGTTSISVTNSLLSMSANGEPSVPVLNSTGAASAKLTTTSLLTDGTVTSPSSSNFDYLDLRSQSGDLLIEPGFTTTSGALISGDWSTLYEFSGFEGYILKGNSTDTSQFIKYGGAALESEIVVVDGGFDLQINLGEDSLYDVLSFRGTTNGATIDLTDTTSTNKDSSANDNFVDFSLANNAGSGAVLGADALFGSDGNDHFTGYADRLNTLAGYDGNDTLIGGTLSDVLVGGLGNDTLSGLGGNDVLIDLDQATMTGGTASDDLFVVRGKDLGVAGELVANITDFEVGTAGPGLGGGNKTYADRIAFNFTVASLSKTSLASVVGSDLLSSANYDLLSEMIEVKVDPVGTSTTNFVVTATLRSEHAAVTETSDVLLGKAMVSLAAAMDGSKYRLEARIEDQQDFLAQVQQTVLDQMLYEEQALGVAAGTGSQSEGAPKELDGTVSLFLSLYHEDKFAVKGGNGDKVLKVLKDSSGQELSTNFRPGQGDEAIVAGRKSDRVEISKIVDVPVTTSFGRDTVVERGGDADAVVMPLQLKDLLDSDDLDLTRIQRGREGEGRSLEIKYHDSTVDEFSMNDVNLTIYKQFAEYDSSFRVEYLELVNDSADGYVQYHLGDATSSGDLTTSGNRDAILVGRTNVDDVMYIVADETLRSEMSLDHVLNVVVEDFDASHDRLAIQGYGTQTASDIDSDGTNEASYSKATITYLDDSDQVSVSRTDHAKLTMDGDTTNNTEIHVYFASGTPLTDDWLFDPSANVA